MTGPIYQSLARGGVLYDLRALDRRLFPIERFAHVLSQIARYGGHTDWPISVAAHSVLVLHLVCRGAPRGYREIEREALLHDLTEACGIGDMCSPVKQTLSEYQELEYEIAQQIRPWFGLREYEPRAVRDADKRAWQIECLFARGYDPESHRMMPLTARERALAFAILSPAAAYGQHAERSFLAHARGQGCV